MSDKEEHPPQQTENPQFDDHPDGAADDGAPNQRPNALVKPNHNLPRHLRARVAGQLLEQLPAGKKQVGPERHFAVERAQHSAPEKAALEDKAAGQGKLKELEKAHNTVKHGDVAHARGPATGQRVYAKTVISANNKMMDSRHRHGDAVGKTHHGMDDGSHANAN